MAAIQGGYRTRADAIAARAKATQRVIAGAPVLAPTRLTVGELGKQVLAERERTMRFATRQVDEAAWSTLGKHVGAIRLQAFTVQRLALLRAELDDGTITGRALKPASTDRYLSILREVLAEAVRRGIIERSPFESLKRRSHRQKTAKSYPHSIEMLEAILAAAELRGASETTRYNYAPLFTFLALSGARIGEALALRWQDIDLLSGTARIERTLLRNQTFGRPKTDAGTREIGLPIRLVNVLALHKPEDAEDDHLVFPSSRDPNTPLLYGNVRTRGWNETLKTAGLEGSGLTPHSLRHAAASLLIAQGHTAPDVARFLGHANAQVTLSVYAHAFGKDTATLDFGAFGREKQEAEEATPA